jgi:hypothetical protein
MTKGGVMKTTMLRKIAVLTLAFLIGTVALAQILHEDADALGLCSNSCKCARCGWALYPGRPCVDWITYCAGSGLVRNCSSYCGAK